MHPRSAAMTGALLLATVLGTAAGAQQVDLDPGAPAGAVTTAHIDRPFDSYALPVAPFEPGRAAQALREVTGRVIWSAYRLEDATASTAGIIDGYRKWLASLGFETILDCATAACGGFDFRFGVSLLPAPAMLLDTADFAQLSARRPADDGSESFASVLVSRVLGAMQIQIVVVLPAETGADAVVGAIERAAAPAIAPQETQSLLDRLTGDGHVTLQGLDFVPGGTDLSDASAPALDITATLLKEHPDLAILIVGHSDNQGGLEANVALSKRRAEAVRAALIERGIDAGRLEAHGVGFLAPVAANATPEGMAVNRRVELVLR
jgi:OOP family OmpA-OmpF porin